MVRLRNALMAVALGIGAMGCAIDQSRVAHYSIWHCSECDDFPTPAYGPGNSMMPGTYTGGVPRDRPDADRAANSGIAPATAPAAPEAGASAPPAVTTPPAAPPASPGLGASGPLPDGGMSQPGTVAAVGDSNLPLLPADSQSAQPFPVAQP